MMKCLFGIVLIIATACQYSSSVPCIGIPLNILEIFVSTQMHSVAYFLKDGQNCTVDIGTHINISHSHKLPVIAIAFACKKRSIITLVNEFNVTRKDIVSYLDVTGQCEIDFHSISTFAIATDLKVLNIRSGANLIINNSTQHRNDVNSIRHLGTLVFQTRLDTGVPNILLDYKWPNLAELMLVNCSMKTFPSRLKDSIPHLQDLNLNNNSLDKPPDFPWDTNTLRLPRNLTRKSRFNEQYGKHVIVQANLYRRFLELDYNLIKNLSKYQFNGYLQRLSLKGNGLHTIGKDCFVNLKGINIIDLSLNQLTELPNGLFRTLTNLLELHLQNNKIKNIEHDILKECKNLNRLYLNHNQITKIPKTMLEIHEELEEVHLENNAIAQVIHGALPNNSNKLKHLFLQNNQLTYIPDGVFCVRSLLKVFMANNKITFQGIIDTLDFIPLYTFTHHCVIESSSSLQYELRKITTYIDLTNNNITTMDINAFNKEQNLKLEMAITVFELNLKNNPLHCDCRILAIKKLLVKVIDKGTRVNFKERFKSWICHEPSNLKGKNLLEIADDALLCAYESPACPTHCTCSIRGVTNSFVIDCRKKHLKELPLTMPIGKELEIYLDGNEIQHLGMRSYLSNTTILHVSNNKIRYINESFIVQLAKLREFRIDSNQIKRLPRQIEMLTSRKSFVSLAIYHNYLLCDCHAKWIKTWMQNVTDKLKEIEKIKCASGSLQGKSIYKVPLKDFICEEDSGGSANIPLTKEPYVIALIILGIVLALFIISVLIYYFRGEMKVFMYVRFNWHPFDRVDDNDPSKIYDVFISYSSLDNQWVHEQLKNQLENHNPPYRTCFHERDFEVGATIYDNILNSVQTSKRMIIVLSNNFIQSEWCRFEFRAAHHRVLEDKAKYLIIILFDDVDTKDLDDEMKLYLRTNTYLNISNNWFWQKLLYALPEPYQDVTNTVELTTV